MVHLKRLADSTPMTPLDLNKPKPQPQQQKKKKKAKKKETKSLEQPIAAVVSKPAAPVQQPQKKPQKKTKKAVSFQDQDQDQANSKESDDTFKSAMAIKEQKSNAETQTGNRATKQRKEATPAGRVLVPRLSLEKVKPTIDLQPSGPFDSTSRRSEPYRIVSPRSRPREEAKKDVNHTTS